MGQDIEWHLKLQRKTLGIFFKATELSNAGSRRGEKGSLSDPDLHLLYLEVNRKVSKFNISRHGVIRYSGGTVITPEQLKPDYS